MNLISTLLMVLATTLPATEREAVRVKAVVAKFTAVRCNIDYINELKAKRDIAGLTAIASTHEPFTAIAASHAIECLPADRVVAYIEQFPLGSWAWGSALQSSARHHPKVVTIRYITSLMERALPENTKAEQAIAAKVRWSCYGICSNRGWDDLAEMAKTEVNDERYFYLVNTGVETVGDAAKSYLELLRRK